ncbi:universal stress protein [Halorientalis salina]|uniref:universal stress protein n=1 Tax=Halorientalis salina TaxID=2932266 RepID=UPI0010AC041A|nr:universal stress protein [Halorientalis salina]
MTFVVPFDGSDLAAAALARAGEFRAAFDRPVVAVSVIPKHNYEFAAERAGLDFEGVPDPETVASRLESQVHRIAPEAEFRYKIVGKYAPGGKVANELRRAARRLDATMVFVGSDNAGHLVNSLSSVGSSVAADTSYDVVIVRHADS